MAQLFQPTNITPDTRGSFGNGVVLIDPEVTTWEDYMPVSWQVNGNVPMTAFQIFITKMDGTLLYATPKLTVGCPFYGTAPDGSPRRFTYTIVQSDISTSFLREASEGLISIDQWWGDGANDVVRQSSPSPYIVRQALTASWTVTGGQPVTERGATFTGTFAGAETDGLMWMRWVLESVTYERGRITSRQTVKDTGRMYGCVEPTFTYDRFLPGDYWLTLSGETSAGVLSGSSGDIIHVEYAMGTSGLLVEATRACNGESAVDVRWENLYNIPRTSVSGSVSDSGQYIYLFSDSSMTWDTVNGSPMDIKTPWSFVWSGYITETGDGDLFSLGLENNRRVEVGLHYGQDETQKYLYYRLMKGSTETYILRLWGNYTDGPCFICITPHNFFIQYERVRFANGLYPAEDLYPDNDLYPKDGDKQTQYHVLNSYLDYDDPDYLQTDLASVTVYGYSLLRYMKVVDHAIVPEGTTPVPGETYDPVTNYMGDDPDTAFDYGTRFLLKSKQGQDWNAGNSSYTSNMVGIALYRKQEDTGLLSPVGTVWNLNKTRMLDYAARSMQGPYTYYLYPLTLAKAESTPAVSNTVNPCFENWTVLSCVKNECGEYEVEKSFLFGLNLASGSVSNNNRPNIMQNFTPYPLVQMTAQNYKSGALQSLIGAIDHSDGQARYYDSTELMEEIWGLSVTTNYLFLKDRKGSLRMIRPSGEITMTTMDGTSEQAQTVSFPWVEVGDASEAQIRKVI